MTYGLILKTTLLFQCIVFARHVWAADYYVGPTGSDTNSGASIEMPWKTITKANQTLNAGDTVYIRAGIYNQYVAPTRSGQISKPITYRNYESETVTISGADYAIYLSGKSYIVVQGINFTQLKRFVYLTNSSSHNIIAHCNFDYASLVNGATNTWAGSVITGNSQHNWIHHCRFSNYGYYNADDIGCVMDIGNEDSTTDATRYNLIEDSSFYHGGHHVMGVYGKFNVIRNNHFHNEAWSMGTVNSDRGAVMYGNRNLSFSGPTGNGGRNLLEGNRVGHSDDPSDNNGASGVSLNSSYNIVRRNTFFHNIGAGLSMSVTSSYLQSILGNKIYSNSFFHNGFNQYNPTDHMSSGLGLGIYSGSWVIKDNVIKNNILYKHRVAFASYNINTANRQGLIELQVFSNNWDGDKQGDPLFVSASTSFVLADAMNKTKPDLHLQTNSPCRDRGGALTTIASASGTGTSFAVSDAGYFMDGWGISGVKGDVLQLAGTTQRARITNVNYDTNTITVDQSLTWTKDQGIGLIYEGTAPDIGAYEISTDGAAAAPTSPQNLKVN